MYAFHRDTGARGPSPPLKWTNSTHTPSGSWRWTANGGSSASRKNPPTRKPFGEARPVPGFHGRLSLQYRNGDRGAENGRGPLLFPRFRQEHHPRNDEDGELFAYNFRDENKKEAKYWRDVGTIDSYWEANMDLVSVDPLLNLYDRNWPIRTRQHQNPPPSSSSRRNTKGAGSGSPSIPSCATAASSAGRVQTSVLSPNVRVNSWAAVEDSILMENVEIGRHAKIRRAIIDKDVYIPTDTVIGYDLEEDRKRFHVSPGGIVVIPKFVKSSLRE
ncbi:MAG: sugar phosphate nucleotidyltransferase [Thermodesulfovibrionales bacterium]